VLHDRVFHLLAKLLRRFEQIRRVFVGDDARRVIGEIVSISSAAIEIVTDTFGIGSDGEFECLECGVMCSRSFYLVARSGNDHLGIPIERPRCRIVERPIDKG
jgi:hypothetical protein